MILKIPPAVLQAVPFLQSQVVGDLRLQLILAMVWQESGGDPARIRWNERFDRFYDNKHKIPLDHLGRTLEENRAHALDVLGPKEFAYQSSAWGALMLMGGHARARGFKGDMGDLCDLVTGVRWGMQHLWEHGFRYGQTSTDIALQRYGGGNGYVKEVLTKVVEIEKVVIL
jgi:hypothetical protein